MLISLVKFVQRVPITYGGGIFKNTKIAAEKIDDYTENKTQEIENHFGLKTRDLKRHPIITAFLNTDYLISISICYMITI